MTNGTMREQLPVVEQLEEVEGRLLLAIQEVEAMIVALEGSTDPRAARRIQRLQVQRERFEARIAECDALEATLASDLTTATIVDRVLAVLRR